MEGVVTELLTLLGNFTGVFGYAGIALVMVVFAPELVMPFAGFLVARGELGFAGVLVAGIVGAMLGQGAIYGLARRVGERRVREFIRRYGRYVFTSERDLDRTLNLFNRFDNALVFFGRAVPTVRSLISVPAGVRRMPFGRFFVLTALGTALWNTLLLYAGTAAGRNWRQLVGLLETYETVILVLLGLAVAALLALRVREQVVRLRSR